MGRLVERKTEMLGGKHMQKEKRQALRGPVP